MLSTILSSRPDHYAIAIFIETHLSLIKSRTLGLLYQELRYNTRRYEDILVLLEEEAKQDYRLYKLLQQLISKFS